MKNILTIVLNFLMRNLTVVFLVLFVFSSGLALRFHSELSDLKKNPQKITEGETRNLIKRVSKLVVLPTDEQPTVATVSDPALLKDQPFFAKAEKGFKVLIYTKSGKSILYDPVGNKIIEVASIDMNQYGSTPTPTPTPTPKKK